MPTGPLAAGIAPLKWALKPRWSPLASRGFVTLIGAARTRLAKTPRLHLLEPWPSVVGAAFRRPDTLFDHCLQGLERVGLGRGLVAPPAQHAREADRHARAVARRRGDRFESQLEHVDRLDVSHGAEALDRVTAN